MADTPGGPGIGSAASICASVASSAGDHGTSSGVAPVVRSHSPKRASVAESLRLPVGGRCGRGRRAARGRAAIEQRHEPLPDLCPGARPRTAPGPTLRSRQGRSKPPLAVSAAHVPHKPPRAAMAACSRSACRRQSCCFARACRSVVVDARRRGQAVDARSGPCPSAGLDRPSSRGVKLASSAKGSGWPARRSGSPAPSCLEGLGRLAMARRASVRTSRKVSADVGPCGRTGALRWRGPGILLQARGPPPSSAPPWPGSSRRPVFMNPSSARVERWCPAARSACRHQADPSGDKAAGTAA